MTVRGLASVVAGIVAAVSLLDVGSGVPASAAVPEFRADVVAQFDKDAGQTPENFALEPDGAVDVTFVGSRQVARVGKDGAVRVLATLPLPPGGGIDTPLAGYPVVGGIARAADGTLFVGYAAGDSRYSGVWRLPRGGSPRLIASLPTESFANGLALDQEQRHVYVADSALGRVWRVRIDGRAAHAAQVWASGAALARQGFAGANGLKVHRGAVWVTNTDAGTLLRIPIARDGNAGRIDVRASGLVNVDDFCFPGRDDRALVALAASSRVVLVRRDGKAETLLTERDGLRDPVGVLVGRAGVYVASSGREPGTQPNLVLARPARAS